jgi:hypothetical protein
MAGILYGAEEGVLKVIRSTNASALKLASMLERTLIRTLYEGSHAFQEQLYSAIESSVLNEVDSTIRMMKRNGKEVEHARVYLECLTYAHNQKLLREEDRHVLEEHLKGAERLEDFFANYPSDRLIEKIRDSLINPKMAPEARLKDQSSNYDSYHYCP